MFWRICLSVMLIIGIGILLGPAFSDTLEKWLQGGSGGLKNQGTALLFMGSGIIAIVSIANNRSLNPINYIPELSAAVFLPLGTLFVLTEENPLLTGAIIVVLVIAVAVILIALLIFLLVRSIPKLIRRIPGIRNWLAPKPESTEGMRHG